MKLRDRKKTTIWKCTAITCCFEIGSRLGMVTYPVLVNLCGECKYDIHGAYGVYNNLTYVLEFWCKLNLYWSTGMRLWQSTRLKAMCPRWTLLAATFHLECKYLQCVCVCVSVCVYWYSGLSWAQLPNYWFICLWPQVHGNAGHVSLTQSKHWEKHGKFKSIFPIQISLHIGLFACETGAAVEVQPFWIVEPSNLFGRVTRRRYQRW